MIKRFSQISSQDVGTCGGKGASLGEMTQAGFPVPNGFVLTTKAFGLNSHERDDQVLRVFDQLDCKFVAVRSSGTKEDGIDDSFAGQFDTYLFVTKEKLIEQIIECHNSIDSDRIISYCESKNINRKDIKVAVVVQKMVNSDVAGVCFTANPVNGNTNEIMIEAGYGLGEAVVSGMITPDNYVVDKTGGNIQKIIYEQTKKIVLDINQGGIKEEQVESTITISQKLSDNHILELAKIADKIEKHYKMPMDTEWAVEDGKLYMLQARPITTITQEDIPEHPDYINHYYKKPMVLFGSYPGLFILDTETWHSIEGGNIFYEIFNKYRGVLNILDITEKNPTLNCFVPFEYMNTVGNHLNVKKKENIERFQNVLMGFYEVKKGIKKTLSNIILHDLSKEDSKEIIKLFELGRHYLHMFAAYDHIIRVAEKTLDKQIHDAMEKLNLKNGNSEYNSTLLTLTQPPYLGTVGEQEIAINNSIISILDGKKTIIECAEQLSNDFGRMPVFTFGESRNAEYYQEIMKDRMKKNRNNIEAEIKRMQNTAEEIQKQRKEIIKKYCISKEALQTFSDYALAIDVRNESEYYISFVSHKLRPLYEEVAKRLHISIDEMRMLFEKEITQGLEKNINIKEILLNRKKIVGFGYNEEMNIRREYDDETCRNLLTFLKKHNYKEQVGKSEGMVASTGIAQGIARIILDPADCDKIKEGEVLVTHTTTVDYLPAMKKSIAIVSEIGGLTSHTAVVAREFKIPCIVGHTRIFDLVHNGDLIEVDANNGLITILKKADEIKSI